MNIRPEWFKKEDRDWEKVYSQYSLAQIPWHSDKPDQEFIVTIESEQLRPCYVLDIGCGTGTDAIYLASKGFNVTAIDISHEAIKIAGGRAGKKDVSVNFITGDFLKVEFDNGSFDFINDRGCFHHMNPLHREDFATKVSRVLKNQGFYYLRCWSDKQERQRGPYSISKNVICHIFSDSFDIGEINDFRFGGKGAMGYACLMTKRT